MATITVDQAFQLAVTYHHAGQLAPAEALYREIISAQPDHGDARHRLAMIASHQGRYEETVKWLSEAVARYPTRAVYHADLGIAYRCLDRINEATASYQQAITLQTDFAEAHSNLGEALVRAGRPEEAVASCQRALALRPDFADACNNLGTAYLRMHRLDEALASFHEALRLQPDHANAYKNLAVAFAERDQWDEAIASAERAVALRPQDAECQTNLGVAFRGRGDFERALLCFRHAVAGRADSVDAHWNLACLLLLLGQYEEGWKEHEWRWKFPALSASDRGHHQRPWTGQPTPGEAILVWAEQGFGDTLQFVRYLPLLRQRSGAQRIALECPSPLRRLLSQASAWDVEVIDPEATVAPRPEFDWQIPLLGLPLALGLPRPDDPAIAMSPYLRADPPSRAAWREKLGEKSDFRVGLVWQGSPLHQNDARRSIPAEKLLPILRVPGVQVFSFQVQRGFVPLGTLAEAGLADLTAHITDFADTAALMAELDLIISVDTAAAHLAGSLGRPVWTLLPFVPDWRWGLEREDTPWYPAMRLFRQKKPGDWDEVIQRVAKSLRESVSSSCPIPIS